jgi:hypothetical protein
MLLMHHNDMRFECVFGYQGLGEIIGNKCETFLSTESWGFLSKKPQKINTSNMRFM